jgi:hypothetical protein
MIFLRIIAVAALLSVPIPLRAQPVTAGPEFGNWNSPALVTLTNSGTGTFDSVDQANRYSRGANVYVNITAETTASIVVALEGKDQSSGSYYDVCVTGAITTTGFTVMSVYPGIATTGSKSASCNGPMPGIYRLEVRVSGSNPQLTMAVAIGLVL